MKKDKQVIVVRRGKKHKHAHHGGSWKIAYADFMTAMMAFFLVMWLLATSTPTQRQQIAEYFRMPLKVAMSNGDRTSMSDSPIPGGGDDFMKSDGEVLRQTLNKIDQQRNVQALERAREKLDSLIQTDPRLNNFQSNLMLSLTDDGLLIQITDTQDRPMFNIGSYTPAPYMRDILQALVPVLNEMPNRISLTGHTDSLPYSGGSVGYSNWELSADRANASRRVMAAAGLAQSKFLRVIGTADMMGLVDTSPDDPSNRRISILVLSKDKEQAILKEDTIMPPRPPIKSHAQPAPEDDINHLMGQVEGISVQPGQ
ncbi:motility protein MotB [Citrobacter amalonaticus]|uniref:Motility protein MotB n=1 Tax=Citrobacter amalonaticus TaxID=35703 RepID=A0A2S4RRF8_CITAM|nr:flagellar motor protein MotB [Citrobacter amalonaticus]POT54756.1 motility protein MotB [Citrobacter amalonaticus]POT69964.1 motility protein MotB [Citrobacter amalonaticus]POU61223.1 motility protein MotB [Citrobacter amalonaticus]POV02577.1 motility protein MotB [Citrobacter amalonaticus]